MKSIYVALLLFASYAVSDLHTLASSDRKMSFPLFHGYQLSDGTFWDGIVSEDRWVYDVSGHASNMFLVLALIVAIGTQIAKNFFILEACDMVDYVLIYNYKWGTVSGFDIDFDLIKIILAFVFTAHFIWTHRHNFGSSD